MSNEKDYVIDRPIDSLAPQLERGYQSLVIEYNKSAAPYPADKTIVELFEAQVERTPEDEAIHSGDQGLTYRELNDRANQMAVKLRTLGTDADQLVALYMGNSIEVVCSMLGVLKAGAAYVPIDINTPKERLVFILQDIAKGLAGTMPVLVTQSSFARDLPDGIARVITLDADFASIGQYPVTNPRFPVSPNNLAYVIYTSGSTGTPKGVMIEHRSLVNYIWWANEKYCRGERLTWPLFSSLAFDLTVTSIFTPLISGGRIVVYHEDPGVHGTVIFKVIEDNVADIVKLTPAHLAMIKGMVSSATKIRKFIVGGEDFKTELASDITRNAGYPVEIYNEYGPTEATVGCMIHRYDRENDLAPSVPIGNPAANTCIFILDENLNPVPIGDIGEMCIAGDGLARGYVNRPELTEEKFVTAKDPRQNLPAAKSSVIGSALLRLYKTGDLARWNAKGSMEFLGRVDNQVKVGGVRIELGEIEARLLKHADVRECVVDVVGWDSKQMADSAEPSKTGEMSINRLVAYYVSEKSLNAAELRAHLAQELPAYMLPPYFIRLDRLPLTSNGKIDRKSLPAPTSDNLAASHDFVRPHTETEKALAAIWTELLKVENIGINDSFFDLGGHSLLAIKAVSHIRDVYNLDLPIQTLFECSTISDLADFLTEVTGTSENIRRIEEMLDQYPNVRKGVAVVTGDANGDKQLVVYLVLNDGEIPSLSALRDYLRMKIPENMVPNAFVILEKFPLTRSGKIDRLSLPLPDDLRPELETAHLAVRMEIERTVTNIWQTVLQLEIIGVNDDFFELGGNLLSSANLIAKINQTFKIKIPLSVIFQERTVSKLALLIEKAKAHKAEFINAKKEKVDLENVYKIIDTSS